MEDDSRSDSGVSTLRSDGARSSGDERSGSRSSAISDDRYKSIILHQGCIFFLNILPLKNVFEPVFFITESGAYEGREGSFNITSACISLPQAIYILRCIAMHCTHPVIE